MSIDKDSVGEDVLIDRIPSLRQEEAEASVLSLIRRGRGAEAEEKYFEKFSKNDSRVRDLFSTEAAKYSPVGMRASEERTRGISKAVTGDRAGLAENWQDSQPWKKQKESVF